MTHDELIALGAGYSPGYEYNGKTMPAMYMLTLKQIEAVEAREREACALVCDGLVYLGWDGETMTYGPETGANAEIRKCAYAIRATATKEQP